MHLTSDVPVFGCDAKSGVETNGSDICFGSNIGLVRNEAIHTTRSRLWEIQSVYDRRSQEVV